MENDINLILTYFNGDDLAANVWKSKYQLKSDDEIIDITPDDMHRRMAKEIAKVEKRYEGYKSGGYAIMHKTSLSQYGADRKYLTENEIFAFFEKFRFLIPGGSTMQLLGNPYQIGSLSNCFVIGQPEDSYSGIMKLREQQVQLMKRRGGVGKDLSSLRPRGASVKNAAKTSTGAASFMPVDSELTREVAQDGRRGALMLTMDIRHPDILEFITAKQDLTKVTGANVSVLIRDDFMEAVRNNTDYILRYPVDIPDNMITDEFKESLPYNELVLWNILEDNHWFKKIKANEYWNILIKCAWNTGEPGIMFLDKHWDLSPDSVYPEHKGVTTNPCFHPDTLIETINGRVKIKDITHPTKVYSMDKDGKLCIRNATASFITKTNAKTIKITLLSGNSIQVTEDHLLYTHERGWIRAKDLQIKERIVHLSRNRRGANYSGIKLTTQGIRDYVMEHRLVYSSFHPLAIDDDIHHIDGDTFNNKYHNLQLLPHGLHSKHTAINQNPQNHQVKDDKNGRFVSGENSKKGAKKIINVPEELSTGLLSRWHNSIISIEEGENTPVYDIMVDETHCLIANNMVAHNCGEIFMSPYDACRLIAMNVYSLVENPFTEDASLNEPLAYRMFYEQLVIADDIVDLEREAILNIMKHIRSSEEDKAENNNVEFHLWEAILRKMERGRRVGCGITGLGDMLAALGVNYGSDQALVITDQLMSIKMEAELDATIDLAILRSPFNSWNSNREFEFNPETRLLSGKNSFFQFLCNAYPEQVLRMSKFGRRNVSWSTVAPTGSISMLTQTTSGIEPLFSLYHIRRVKMDVKEGVSDYIDPNNGDWFKEYFVLHPKVYEWYSKLGYDIPFNEHSKEKQLSILNSSPWANNLADDINTEARIKTQAIIQRYTTHSISSTVNLPNHVDVDTVGDLYMRAWINDLKGITVYRDGSRAGVIVKKKEEEFEYHHAPSRGKELDANFHQIMVKGERFGIIVGLKNRKPYEIFAVRDHVKGTKFLKGKTIKIKKGSYTFFSNDGKFTYENVQCLDNIEERATTLYGSMLLRHGTPITHVIKTMKKVGDSISSFTSAITRVLSLYIPDGMVSAENCPSCGSKLVFENGCSVCKNCGESTCG